MQRVVRLLLHCLLQLLHGERDGLQDRPEHLLLARLGADPCRGGGKTNNTISASRAQSVQSPPLTYESGPGVRVVDGCLQSEEGRDEEEVEASLVHRRGDVARLARVREEAQLARPLDQGAGVVVRALRQEAEGVAVAPTDHRNLVQRGPTGRKPTLQLQKSTPPHIPLPLCLPAR